MFAGCLKNAQGLAQALPRVGPQIGRIPAGERWPDGRLRPVFEDVIGAGAIIHRFPRVKSPEASLAEATFLHFRAQLYDCLRRCSSGKELIDRGFARDVEVAAVLDEETCTPVLRAVAYVPYIA